MVRVIPVCIALAAAVLAAASPAFAAEATCGRSETQPGATVHGPVLLTPDADTLCLASGPTPDTWIRIKLATASPTRAVLMAAAFGKNADCLVDKSGTASCTIEGQSLEATLGSPEIVKASLAWR
jgi:hypothetical protein